MREILFKGKRVDNGEWVYGSLVMVADGESLKKYPCIVISYNHDTFDWYQVQEETIGQYTGLKDKNGVKIFEGDYLHMPGYYCEVVFIDGGFHTVYNHPEDGETLPILDLDLYQMEVIGNIHDKQ